jgi:ABC-type bacteriocin/lantibiotic exporter with double-glycine peptidase domain
MLPAFDPWQDWVRQCGAAQNPALSDGQPLTSTSLAQSIEFENVSYQHPHSDKRFLIPLLRIPARQTTAIIGPTGAGKTTLLDLLCGLTPPASGQIRTDGRPLLG